MSSFKKFGNHLKICLFNYKKTNQQIENQIVNQHLIPKY